MSSPRPQPPISPPTLTLERLDGPVYGLPRQVPPPRRQRVGLPVGLFLATCLSTWLINGPVYAVALMGILTAHELGHYLQARRYHIPASLPYFIPFPSILGTLGAIIAMRSQSARLKELFDVAISGPIAGLVPSLVVSYAGLRMSSIVILDEVENSFSLGAPLVFEWLSLLAVGPVEEGYDILLHPLAYAGWVGIFVTALNLVPISQTDGGHILYALAPDHAHRISTALLAAAVVLVVASGYWWWSLFLVLLMVLGPRHPPAAEEHLRLDPVRKVLGWLMLAFFIVGFTPRPFIF